MMQAAAEKAVLLYSLVVKNRLVHNFHVFENWRHSMKYVLDIFIYTEIAIFLFTLSVWGGQELVHNFQLAPDDLRPNDIAIIQFETRPLHKAYKSASTRYENNYWNVSARWNKAYARRHGHQFGYIALHSKKGCRTSRHELSVVWCKVIAMIRAHDLLPKAKAFLYLDSDAVMTTNYSLSDIVGFVRKELKWDMTQQPMAFNQDGPGWACKHTMKYSYPYCLNSGTLFW